MAGRGGPQKGREAMRRKRRARKIVRGILEAAIMTLVSIAFAGALIYGICNDSNYTGPDEWNRNRIETTAHYEAEERSAEQ